MPTAKAKANPRDLLRAAIAGGRTKSPAVNDKTFLVELSHSDDRFPLAVFASRPAAIKFGKTVLPFPSPPIRKMLGSDGSTPLGVYLITFKAERPIGREALHLFEDDEVANNYRK